MRFCILAFALGVVALQMQGELPPWPWAWLGGAVGGVFLLLLCRRLGRGRAATSGALRIAAYVVAGLVSLALGFAWAAWRAEVRLAEGLPEAWEGRDLVVVGVVAGLPQDFSQGQRFEFAVESVLTPGATVPGRIMLSLYQGRREDETFTAQPLVAGERWRFKVRLKRPHGNANPMAFDYEAWLLERDIRATGYVRPGPGSERLSALVAHPAYLVERLRQGVRDTFLARLPEADYPFAGILVALAVGDQRAIQGSLWTTFNRTGTTHLMSVSGLHITLVAALCGWLVAALWRRLPALAVTWPAQRTGMLAGWGAALVYTLLAGFAVPAQRTLYMLTVALLAALSGRQVPPSRVLALALLAVLLCDPWAVLAPGFWLSFGAVAALLFVGAGQVVRVRSWRERLALWGWTQWAATLASLPVLVLVFQQFSLVSPLANTLAIPLVSFVVTPLALAAALAPWWPLLALAHGVMSGLMAFLFWCAAGPQWVMPAPPLAAVLLAVAGVGLLLLPRGLTWRWVGVALILPAAAWPVARPAAGEAWVTVLDVGQGLAVLVRTREHSLLYDTGPLYSAESDAGQRVVVPYLRVLGVNRLDLLMVTHRDADHAGGAASVLAAVPVDRRLGSVPELGGEACQAGQRWSWDGVDFAVLHPGNEPAAEAGGAGRQPKTNHQSCVLRITAGNHRLLLTSDIEAADEAAILARAALDPEATLAADILLVPHHGSRTSSTPAFLEAVGAEDAIVPVGYRNRFGHPKAEVLARYAERGIRLWRTDGQGAILVRLGDPPGLEAWRESHRRYWQGR